MSNDTFLLSPTALYRLETGPLAACAVSVPSAEGDG